MSVLVYMLRPNYAEMKARLAASELLKEAEAMGFKISIELPPDCLMVMKPLKEEKESADRIQQGTD